MKEVLEVMVDNGATPYWYAMACIPIVVRFQVYCLEVDNKFTRTIKKVVKYLLEDFIDIIK
jgi:hypothetical protein|nr:MAG TPA: hypothetical protein [Caudoviricetes sp.]